MRYIKPASCVFCLHSVFAATGGRHFFRRGFHVIMKAVLGLSIFSVLLSTGASLECETCTSSSSICTGRMKTCSYDEDTCFTLLSETSGVGVKTYVIAKGCSNSQFCKREPNVLNFGQRRFQRDAVSCCVGNECAGVYPRLKPINTTTNGKKCPACLSVTGRCPSEVVQCTGFDDYCFHMVTPAIKGTVVTTKGCTTSSTCNKFQATQGIGYSEVECQQASKASWIPGSPLLVLSGFLWMKVFY
ncbi:phospholipase A2 inhibitor and Ly6/PLAUR domain-containing protein-like isoform X1 [Anolis sagrei]|uniref:phospholipase A2 inhibitor and Ly6/PLAUR domain-containing protein-like isoform X1 n=1 Tax=Anolis sagrei TaxID=38937 RepID=UPI00351F8801